MEGVQGDFVEIKEEVDDPVLSWYGEKKSLRRRFVVGQGRGLTERLAGL